jgi:hypothetical protein
MPAGYTFSLCGLLAVLREARRGSTHAGLEQRMRIGNMDKPRQSIVPLSGEWSRPCRTNVTYWIDTGCLSRIEGLLLGAVRPWVLVKRMSPKHGRVQCAPE